MVLKIGHRGAAGYEPENTLLSFKKALDMGVDMVELDIHLCRSGELVVIHDDKLDRTTNAKGFVIHKTLSEIKAADAGKGEQIPALSEVFDLVNKKAVINIEVKEKNTIDALAQIIKQYIRKGWSYSDFLISSFDIEILYAMRELLGPGARIGFLSDKILPKLAGMVVDLDVFSLNIEKNCVNLKFINEMHLLGFKVLVWTLNDPEEIKQFIDYGVDGIFSDFPDRIK